MKRFYFVATLLLLGMVVSLLSHSELGISACWAGAGSPIQKSAGVNHGKLGDVPIVCDSPGPGISCATNGFYNVYVRDNTGQEAGEYTATLGVQHPAQPPAAPPLNVLSGGEFPKTSYLTVRVYNPASQPPCDVPPCVGVEYIQGSDFPGDHGADDGYTLKSLGPYAKTQKDVRTVMPIIGPTGGPTGFQTTYELPAPENMTIVQVVNVNGTTYEDSTVEVTTRVRNTGTADLNIGIRYRWDLQIGLDDGPTLQPGNLNGLEFVPSVDPPFVNEVEYSKPLYVMSRIVDNDMNPNPPTYYVFATNTGPDWVRPKPTPPFLFQYACFYLTDYYAFDNQVDPSFCIAKQSCGTCGSMHGGDSVILYYFGEDPSQPITIKAGEEYQASESLLVSRTKVPPHPPDPPHPTEVPAVSGLTMITFFILLAGIYAVFMGRRRKGAARSQ